MKYIKVKDKDYLERDSISNGIVNNDINGYLNYIEDYKKKYNFNQKVQNLEDDMKQIKNDMDEIKSLLRNLKNES